MQLLLYFQSRSRPEYKEQHGLRINHSQCSHACSPFPALALTSAITITMNQAMFSPTLIPLLNLITLYLALRPIWE